MGILKAKNKNVTREEKSGIVRNKICIPFGLIGYSSNEFEITGVRGIKGSDDLELDFRCERCSSVGSMRIQGKFLKVIRCKGCRHNARIAGIVRRQSSQGRGTEVYIVSNSTYKSISSRCDSESKVVDSICNILNKRA